MDLLLIRHAQPERIDNASGPADPNLTPLGHRQAKAAALWLSAEIGLDALYCSPLARALQTAAPFESEFGLPAQLVDGVKEYDAGDASYVPMEDIRTDRAAWRTFVEQQVERDYAEFTETVTTALEELIERHRGQTIAVVCHGGVINVWASVVIGLSRPTMFFSPAYTSMNRFKAASTGQRAVVSLNETAHLRSVGARAR
jgi:probable phosphoglycerate mutase